MADKITWANKVSLVTDPTIAEINKVTDDNMNEIKSVTNTNADELAEKIVYDEDDITENTGLIIEEMPEGSNIPYLNSEIDNEYGTATNRGYSQEYINGIIESGSNANGNYIKYVNGTMICTGVKNFTGVNFTTQNGSVYIPATSPTINFAQQFIENPVVTLTAFNRANGVYESGLSTSLVAIWPFAFSSITNVNYSIHYIAIGRWK